MWKVRRVEDRGRIVLKLIGRLEGNQLSELEDAFGSEADVQSLILDLTDVRLVDQDAVRFLAGCEARGAQLRNYPAYIREWIDADKASRESTLNQH
jgi:anti-anti-sigma regulatory factor